MNSIVRTLIIIAIASVLAAGLSGCASKTDRRMVSEAQSGEIIERVDDVGLLRLDVPAFSNLTPDERIACYYLAQAIISSRDIPYDQIHPKQLEIRAFLEQIGLGIGYGAPQEFTAPYWIFLKQLWIHNGFYDLRSLQKRPVSITGRELSNLMFVALSNSGGELGTLLQINLKRSWIVDTLFVPEIEPTLIPRRPNGDVDFEASTPVHFYQQVTLQEARSFQGNYPHNSRLIKKHGGIVEWVCRTGDETVAPGPYAAALSRVIDYLEKARPYVPPQRVEAIDHLVDYFTTGDPSAFSAASKILRTTEANVDFILGFNDIRYDPLAEKALWSGLLFIADEDAATAYRTFQDFCRKHPPPGSSASGSAFDDRMIKPVQLLAAVGNNAPLCPDQYEDSPAGEVGGAEKQVLIFTNVIKDRAVSQARYLDTALCADEAERERCAKYAAPLSFLENMARAMTSPLQHPPIICVSESRPNRKISHYIAASALAEMKVLWWLTNPDLVATGLIPGADAALETEHRFIRRYIRSLSKPPTEVTVPEAAVQWIGNFLLADDEIFALKTAVEPVTYQLKDASRFRNKIEEAIVTLAKILNSGDDAALTAFEDRYAESPCLNLSTASGGRRRTERPLREFAFLMPTLDSETTPMGGIRDVNLHYAPNFAVRMFQLAGWGEEDYDWLTQ